MIECRIGVLKGDGIGLEIVDACLRVLERVFRHYADLSVSFIECPMGLAAISDFGVPMPDSTVETLRSCDGWIMGPYDSSAYPEAAKIVRNPSGELRHTFDLYANIRPVVCMEGVPSVIKDLDLVVVRENTEGFYPDRNMSNGIGEFMPTNDVALSVGVFTRRAMERIARMAYGLARMRRKHVTIVHKANVIKMAYGMFLNICSDMSAEYPDVVVDNYHMDAMMAHLVKRGKDFDVIVTTNMFGDILSDLTAALAGSLGIAPSINANEMIAMAQAAHGSAPDIAGLGIANPTGIIMSAAMLFEWLGRRRQEPVLSEIALRVEQAVKSTYKCGMATRDLGGNLATTEFTQEVMNRL